MSVRDSKSAKWAGCRTGILCQMSRGRPLAVWRRVPKRALLTSNIDINARLSAAETASFDDKNPVSQRKELWIFWYGDKPEDVFKRLVSPELKEVTDISGTWENALPYEARTLLYKALNNLIER